MDEKDHVCQTALHKAAMNGWLECVSFLLSRGASVHATDLAGKEFVYLKLKYELFQLNQVYSDLPSPHLLPTSCYLTMNSQHSCKFY